MININPNSIKEILKIKEYANDAVYFLNSLYDYTDYILRLENEIAIIKLDLDKYGADYYRESIENLDMHRRAKHNSAISSLNALNKISIMLKIPFVYPGDPNKEYRGDVATSIFEFCKNILDNDKYGIKFKK